MEGAQKENRKNPAMRLRAKYRATWELCCRALQCSWTEAPFRADMRPDVGVARSAFELWQLAHDTVFFTDSILRNNFQIFFLFYHTLTNKYH